MTYRIKFLDRETYARLEKQRLDEIHDWLRAYPNWMNNSVGPNWPTERSRISYDVVPPGSLWECWWEFNPDKKAQQLRRDRALKSIYEGSWQDQNQTLSSQYWLNWSHKRPPVRVKTPNGVIWSIDFVASSGPGWTVSDCNRGDYGSITVSPSVCVKGYTGHLLMGQFSFDHASPYPNGTVNGRKAE